MGTATSARAGRVHQGGRPAGERGRPAHGEPKRAGRRRGRHERPGPLVGVVALTRLALRRSRWFYLVWVLALWATTSATVAKYHDLMPDPRSARATADGLAGNVTMRAMLGPPYDLLTAGGFTMWRVGTFVAVGAAMMAALGVIRATRAEEEAGRLELVRSGVVGRRAPLAAGMAAACLACGALGLLIAVTLSVQAPSAGGAVAMGLGVALTGTMFAGVGAVAAQLFESTRTARSCAMYVLAACYLVRAVADGVAEDSAFRRLQWASPLEWAALTRPYADERWAVLLLPLVVTLLLLRLAHALEDRRDHGGGLRPPALGPAGAGPELTGVAGLASRLHRGSIVGWTIGVLVGGWTVGLLGKGLGSVMGENPQVAEMMRRMGGGARGIEDAFIATILLILATVLAMLVLQILAVLRHEEESGHTELLLASATSRTRLVLAHLVPALAAPAVLLVLAGALMSFPMAHGQPGRVGDGALAALLLVPGLWIVAGIATVVEGWAPRLAFVGPLVVGWSAFVTWLGSLLGLPDVILHLHPWGVLPRLPGDDLRWWPVLTVTVAAAALLVAGVAGYRRRDIRGR